MQEELISYTTVKLAKDKGIDFRTDIFKRVIINNKAGTYHAYVTQGTLQRYLRETHEILVTVAPYHENRIDEDLEEDEFERNTLYSFFVHKRTKFIKDDVDFPTYEQALEYGLQEGLKLIEVDEK